MRRIAWAALALVASSCGFPEYQFTEEVPAPVTTVCDESPCQNGGECVPTDAGFACLCLDGFRGDQCEVDVDECEDNPCQNGGTCLDGVDEYTCTCPLGFSGRHCQDNLDDCMPNPCKNDGVCEDGVADYSCECPEGFSGDTCAGALAPTCQAILDEDPSSESGIIVAKQRNGPTGKVMTKFTSEYTRFDNLAPDEYSFDEFDDFATDGG